MKSIEPAVGLPADGCAARINVSLPAGREPVMANAAGIMKRYIRASILVLCGCLASRGTCAQGPTPPAREITTSFVVFGDCRLDKEQAGADNPSSANVAQLRQTLKDISKLEPKPAYIFFTGDLVENEADDHGQTLAVQLAAWAKLYRQLCREFGLAVPLVPIPGNHELLKSVVRNGKRVEEVNPFTDSVWLNWLERNKFGRFAGNGPTAAPPNPDRLAGDNRRLTYSFDDDVGDHFIILNTSTLNNQRQPPRGWIPYHWIARDARRAEANPRVKHIFAFGHKPIKIPFLPFDPTGNYSILNTPSHPLARQLEATFGGLAKFDAYGCGHLHLWDCRRLLGWKHLWQLIAGNGGSELIRFSEGAWQAPYFFGFTVVRVHADGSVGIVNYRRPVPQPFDSTAPQPPARSEPEMLLVPKRDVTGGGGQNTS